MLTVQHYELVRRKVIIEGRSQRGLAKELHHSRKTIANALELRIPPDYRLSKPRLRPVLEKDGKKTTFGWEDIHRINKLTAQEYKYLRRLEDDFVASEQTPVDFLTSDKAKRSLLKIYDVWADRISDLKKVEDKNERLRIVISSLGERLTNQVSKPRVLQKWYQVRISRAKTASEKQRLAKEYMEVRKQRLIEALKVQPKTAREIELTRKITEMLQSR